MLMMEFWRRCWKPEAGEPAALPPPTLPSPRSSWNGWKDAVAKADSCRCVKPFAAGMGAPFAVAAAGLLLQFTTIVLTVVTVVVGIIIIVRVGEIWIVWFGSIFLGQRVK